MTGYQQVWAGLPESLRDRLRADPLTDLRSEDIAALGAAGARPPSAFWIEPAEDAVAATRQRLTPRFANFVRLGCAFDAYRTAVARSHAFLDAHDGFFGKRTRRVDRNMFEQIEQLAEDQDRALAVLGRLVGTQSWESDPTVLAYVERAATTAPPGSPSEASLAASLPPPAPLAPSPSSTLRPAA